MLHIFQSVRFKQKLVLTEVTVTQFMRFKVLFACITKTNIMENKLNRKKIKPQEKTLFRMLVHHTKKQYGMCFAVLILLLQSSTHLLSAAFGKGRISTMLSSY